MTYITLYFVSNEYLRLLIFPTLGSLKVPLAGGCSGAIAWLASFPFDLVKSRVQGRDVAAVDPLNQSPLTVARAVLRDRGCLGLYAGIVPSLTRAFLVSATRFTVYDSVFRVVNNMSQT